MKSFTPNNKILLSDFIMSIYWVTARINLNEA